MQEVLIRAGYFIAIILMGYVLRRINFFKEGDFKVLAKVVIKITAGENVQFMDFNQTEGGETRE